MLSFAEYQRRTLYLLEDMRNMMKEKFRKNPDSSLHIKTLSSLAELKDFHQGLTDEKLKELVSY